MFFQGIFCEEEKIAEARYWVVSKVFRVSHMKVAMKTVGKAEATRSESAT